MPGRSSIAADTLPPSRLARRPIWAQRMHSLFPDGPLSNCRRSEHGRDHGHRHTNTECEEQSQLYFVRRRERAGCRHSCHSCFSFRLTFRPVAGFTVSHRLWTFLPVGRLVCCIHLADRSADGRMRLSGILVRSVSGWTESVAADQSPACRKTARPRSPTTFGQRLSEGLCRKGGQLERGGAYWAGRKKSLLCLEAGAFFRQEAGAWSWVRPSLSRQGVWFRRVEELVSGVEQPTRVITITTSMASFIT